MTAVRDFIERAWNAGESAEFVEHLAPSFAFPGGPDGFKALVFRYREAFTDFHMEVHEIFGVDDKVVTRLTMHGTHTAQFMGVAPTGRTISMGGIAIDVMENGQRVGGGAQLDQLGLLPQLGVVGPDHSAM